MVVSLANLGISGFQTRYVGCTIQQIISTNDMASPPFINIFLRTAWALHMLTKALALCIADLLEIPWGLPSKWKSIGSPGDHLRCKPWPQMHCHGRRLGATWVSLAFQFQVWIDEHQ